MNKIVIALIAILVLFGVNKPSFAMMCDMGNGSSNGEAHTESTEKGSAINAGNKICPVTGEAIDGKTTYEYQGKVYNFCCPMCIGQFKNNPQQYIKKIEVKAKSTL